MKNYKLRKQYNTVLDTVLTNRGLTLEMAQDLLNPPEESIIHPLEMKNMKRAIDMLNNHIENNSKIGVLIDNDCDGFCSSSMIYNLLKSKLWYKNLVYFIHNKNKAHGLEESITKEIIESELDLLIIPDAGSSSGDSENQKKLVSLGMNILVLDHHMVECEETEGVVIVNPHNEGCKGNKNLSGAGVTYKFIQAFCQEYHQEIDHTEYIDLFSLSLISDVCDMRNLENRVYYIAGSDKENIRNPLILEYISSKKLDGEYLTIEQLGFSIAPYINSIVRLGTKKERELLFIAMADQKLVESNKRGCFGQMALATEEAVRVSNNVKSKQDKQKKEGAKKVLERIHKLNLLDNKIIVCDVTDILSPSLTGLAANTILNEVQRPIILLRSSDGVNYTGSARNYGDSIDKLKDLCESTNLFDSVAGHQAAFGCFISKDNLELLNDKFNEMLKDISFESDVEIDGIYEGDIPIEDIHSVADFSEVWCNQIKEPTFLIKSIRISTRDIQKSGVATYKFKHNNCHYVKNFGSKVWYEEFRNPGNSLPFGGDLDVEVLCKFRRSHNGFYYLEIVDAWSKKSE